ncbi:MAG: hypothetical protein Q9218_005664 [Villophora microphyllina]
MRIFNNISVATSTIIFLSATTYAWDFAAYSITTKNCGKTSNGDDFSYVIYTGTGDGPWIEIGSPISNIITNTFCTYFTSSGASDPRPCTRPLAQRPGSFHVGNGFCRIFIKGSDGKDAINWDNDHGNSEGMYSGICQKNLSFWPDNTSAFLRCSDEPFVDRDRSRLPVNPAFGTTGNSGRHEQQYLRPLRTGRRRRM